ncbi:MAG: hypothetical protein RJA49_2604 [Actinomycetota bacterium]
MHSWVRWTAAMTAGVLVAGAVWLSQRVPAAEVDRVVVAPSVTGELPVLHAGPVPSIAGASEWLNSPPLRDKDLVGHVVLVDFWTFGCINCQHTLSHVKAWFARYASDGLLLVSVHTPEFAYEAEPANVAEYVRREGISYPVTLDPHRVVWRAWDNHAWPAFYLYDRSGRLRLVHLGEGRYEATEDAIRALLGVEQSSARAGP